MLSISICFSSFLIYASAQCDSILDPDPVLFHEEAGDYAEKLANDLESQYQATVVPRNDTRNPFTKYTTRIARNSKKEDVLLPLVIRATITRDTVTRISRNGDIISAAAKENIEKMADGLERDSYDNGHIISFQNGETYVDQVYNFFPQNKKLNKGKYKIVENYINKWARFDGTVNMIVVLQYPANVVHVTRPEKVVLKATFYDQNGEISSDCKTIVFYNKF
ncbi:hypothetical protein O0L34_g3479 [Tuta absoluta]|nr:hypothetical protein O0L34_g3479 [Tuta absoluta]